MQRWRPDEGPALAQPAPAVGPEALDHQEGLAVGGRRRPRSAGGCRRRRRRRPWPPTVVEGSPTRGGIADAVSDLPRPAGQASTRRESVTRCCSSMRVASASSAGSPTCAGGGWRSARPNRTVHHLPISSPSTATGMMGSAGLEGGGDRRHGNRARRGRVQQLTSQGPPTSSPARSRPRTSAGFPGTAPRRRSDRGQRRDGRHADDAQRPVRSPGDTAAARTADSDHPTRRLCTSTAGPISGRASSPSSRSDQRARTRGETARRRSWSRPHSSTENRPDRRRPTIEPRSSHCRSGSSCGQHRRRRRSRRLPAARPGGGDPHDLGPLEEVLAHLGRGALGPHAEQLAGPAAVGHPAPRQQLEHVRGDRRAGQLAEQAGRRQPGPTTGPAPADRCGPPATR